MTNWYEVEEYAAVRSQELNRCLTGPEFYRIQFLEELRLGRRSLRARFGAALVRIGSRLDPQAVDEAADALVEGRLAGYLREPA